MNTIEINGLSSSLDEDTRPAVTNDLIEIINLAAQHAQEEILFVTNASPDETTRMTWTIAPSHEGETQLSFPAHQKSVSGSTSTQDTANRLWNPIQRYSKMPDSNQRIDQKNDYDLLLGFIAKAVKLSKSNATFPEGISREDFYSKICEHTQNSPLLNGNIVPIDLLLLLEDVASRQANVTPSQIARTFKELSAKVTTTLNPYIIEENDKNLKIISDEVFLFPKNGRVTFQDIKISSAAAMIFIAEQSYKYGIQKSVTILLLTTAKNLLIHENNEMFHYCKDWIDKIKDEPFTS